MKTWHLCAGGCFFAREDGRVVAGDAQAAEQASQSKSMFLATVSQSCERRCMALSVTWICCKPKITERRRSSGDGNEQLFQPVVKIISDILDFSKIESEQLKIDRVSFHRVK